MRKKVEVCRSSCGMIRVGHIGVISVDVEGCVECV